MDGIGMDTKQFLEKMRRENFQHAESSRVDYQSHVLPDFSVSDSFNSLNTDVPAGESVPAFCAGLYEAKQDVWKGDHNNCIYTSTTPLWKKDDTVELFAKKPVVEPSEYSRVVFPITNDILQPAQRPTELLMLKTRPADSAALDPKLRAEIPRKEDAAEGLNPAATKSLVRRPRFSLDVWKILTIVNTLLLVEMMTLCLLR